MEARSNEKLDRIVTFSNEERHEMLNALNSLFMIDGYYGLSVGDRRRIGELYDMLNF